MLVIFIINSIHFKQKYTCTYMSNLSYVKSAETFLKFILTLCIGIYLHVYQHKSYLPKTWALGIELKSSGLWQMSSSAKLSNQSLKYVPSLLLCFCGKHHDQKILGEE